MDGFRTALGEPFTAWLTTGFLDFLVSQQD
jgi:hypothetical protein